MAYIDPHFPPPQSLQDVIQLLTIGGTECIKPAVQWLEANGNNGHPTKVAIAHYLLNEGGYLLEDVCGVPDETFGAGGSNKNGGGGG